MNRGLYPGSPRHRDDTDYYFRERENRTANAQVYFDEHFEGPSLDPRWKLPAGFNYQNYQFRRSRMLAGEGTATIPPLWMPVPTCPWRVRLKINANMATNEAIEFHLRGATSSRVVTLLHYISGGNLKVDVWRRLSDLTWQSTPFTATITAVGVWRTMQSERVLQWRWNGVDTYTADHGSDWNAVEGIVNEASASWIGTPVEVGFNCSAPGVAVDRFTIETGVAAKNAY